MELTSTAKTVSVYIEDNQSSQEESKEPVEQAAEKSAETAEPSEGSQEQPASEQDSVPAEEPANIDAEEVILDNPNLEKIIREQLPKPEGALLKKTWKS